MVEHQQAAAIEGVGEMSPVNLSPETLEEVAFDVDAEGPEIPPDYMRFAIAWSTLNRVYNENRSERFETQQVISFGDQIEGLWEAVAPRARALVLLECIGGEKDPSGILKPKPEVKSATIYLREYFHIDDGIDSNDCHFHACRPEKRAVCNPVASDPWGRSKMGALLRLVYQVRCNLVHGDKRLMASGFQRERDHRLVELSYEILKIILREIVSTVGKTE